MSLKQLNQWKTWNGILRKFVHESSSTRTPMKFCIFLPPQAQQKRVPALYWLSGLTCTEDNFVQKAGAFASAAREGIALICPDTSPRGANIPGDKDSWDLGEGAGFYVNATQEKWANHYRMYDYVVSELPKLIKENFPVNDKQSVFGHSMGGHGALITYLKNPGMYRSVSAFAPICNPVQAPWGIKAFTEYLGSDQNAWKAWDATHLASNTDASQFPNPILIDQGTEDEFLSKGQLLPENFAAACAKAKLPVTLRFQRGYDHSYFFIQTFIDDHIKHHAQYLFS